MSLQLDDVLSQYEAALIKLEQSQTLEPKDALTALVSRDRVQATLKQNPVSSSVLLALLQYDERLKNWAEPASQTLDFANWRTLVNPDAQAWWWFLDVANQPQQLDALTTYEKLITQLARSLPDQPQQQAAAITGTTAIDGEQLATAAIARPVATTDDPPSLTRQMLGIYLVRDVLQQQIEEGELAAEQLETLSQSDEHFRQQLMMLSQKMDRRHLSELLHQLDKVRSVLNPSPDAWWWFSKVNVHWWDRLDWAWNTLTLVWLAASFSLLTDTTTRFFAGGPGVVGGFAVIFQAFLALMGGGSLTRTGQNLVERTLERFNLPKHYWQEVRFLGATLLLLLFVGMRSLFPILARAYNNIGLEDYKGGRFSSAEASYQRAIALNPNFSEAHYNLGLLYEDLQNHEQARSEYALAAQGEFILAYNNLARLEILAGNYREAFTLMQTPQVQTYLQDVNANPEWQYTLFKNTAWALQGLGFHQDAVKQLQQAIELNGTFDEKKASAYCLLAQNLEELDRTQSALNAWTNCLRYSETLRNPEEYEWLFTARQRVQEDSEKPQ